MQIRRYLTWSLLSLAVLALYAPSVHAACSKASSGWPYTTQHLYDVNFEQLGAGTCYAWQTTNEAGLDFDGDTCSVMNDYGMVLAGDDDSISSSFYQDIDFTGVTGDTYSVSFYVDLQGSLTSWDSVNIYLEDANTGSYLESVLHLRGTDTHLDCDEVLVELDGNYDDEEVRLMFESTIYGTSADRFIFDRVKVLSVDF